MKTSQTRLPWTFSFPVADIPPGETRVVQVQPQRLFRGERVTAECPCGYDDDLLLTHIFVGKKSQLKIDETIPLSLLVEDALVRNFDTCDKALHLSVNIKNTSTVPRRVYLFFHGIATP